MSLAEVVELAPPETGVQGAVWRAMRLAGVPLGTKGAREVVLAITWFIRQQPKILNRFDPDQNDAHTQEGLTEGSYWREKIPMYLHRASLLELGSPQGRQAVAEFAATAMGLLASVWRVYGPPASAGQDFSRGVKGVDAARKVE